MKAILLDFGGIISLHKGLYYIPIYPDTDEWHKVEKGEIPEEEFWKKLEKFYQKSTEEILDMLVKEREPNTKLLDFLKEIKPKIKTGFITNSLSKLTRRLVEEWKLKEIFEVMVISSEEKLAKPDPQIFLLSLQKLKVSPEECLYVGKKGSYVDVALSLGMRSFLYCNFDDFKERILRILEEEPEEK